MANTDYQIFTDGGSRGNPGPAAIGVVVYRDKKILHKFGKAIGTTTNNVAEYRGVIEALRYLKTLTFPQTTTIHFMIDSQLIVNQLNGLFKIKDASLRELYVEVKVLEQEVGAHIFYDGIPREQNTKADAVVNQALDRKP